MATNAPRRKRARPSAATEPRAGADAPLSLGPLPHYTGYVLRRAQLALFEQFIAVFRQLDLRPAQFSVLLVVEANPGRRQAEIAAALSIRQANLVGLIDELDRRGLTRRKRLAADRRAYALTLTAKGAALLKKACTLQAQFDERLKSELGASDHTRLIATLTKLHRLLTTPNPSASKGVARSRPSKRAKAPVRMRTQSAKDDGPASHPRPWKQRAGGLAKTGIV